MSLYHIITNRFVKPVIEEHEERGRKEGIAEGEERANRAWANWNQSRLEHEAQGIPFNELPPHNGKEA